jgi:hypothetical protein
VRVYALGETEELEVDIESLTYDDRSKTARGEEP